MVYFLCYGTSVASVSFVIQAELLNTQSGAGSPAPSSSLVLLIADTLHNGFAALQAGNSLTLGSLLGGDDKIIFRTNLSGFSTTTNGVLSTATPALTLDNVSADTTAGSWSPGDPLAIIWFPGLTLASGLLSAGDRYGRLTLGTGAGNTPSSDPFITPADLTGDYHLFYFSNEAGANNLNGQSGPGSPTSANLTVVPEPGSLSLLCAAGVLLCLSHRRYSRPVRIPTCG